MTQTQQSAKSNDAKATTQQTGAQGAGLEQAPLTTGQVAPTMQGLRAPTPAQLLYLQRTVGNQAVQRLLEQHKAQSSSHAPANRVQAKPSDASGPGGGALDSAMATSIQQASSGFKKDGKDIAKEKRGKEAKEAKKQETSDAPRHIQRFSEQSNGQMAPAPTRVDQALASPIRSHTTAGTVQRFEAEEHQKIGEIGSGGKMVELAPGYRIPFGDMVALAGDHFESIQQMRQFAQKPSGEESRAEIEYARKWKLKREGLTYDDDAKKSAEARYYKLAARNRSHFVNPEVGDEQLSTLEKAKLVQPGPEKIDVPLNAIAGYRLNHVKAIQEAETLGAAGAPIDAAMAVDAFACHYLTDSFSAGHLRTPRESIRVYWNAKVPMFFHNMQGYMAERIAEKLGGFASIFSEQLVYEQALKKIIKALQSMGRIDFGDLVSLALHDWDNGGDNQEDKKKGIKSEGLKATIEGKDVELFGDGKLGQSDEQTYAVRAVELSVQDIESAYNRAYNHASSGELVCTPSSADLLLGKDGLYDAERMLPKAKPDAQLSDKDKSINWKHSTPESLLNHEPFQKALYVFAKGKVAEIDGVAKDFSDAQKKALELGVTEPLLRNPSGEIKKVIDWTPQTGGGVFGHDTDDNSVDYYQAAAKTPGGLKSLTRVQRVRLIRDLDEGFITFDSEEEKIWDILKTASDADARWVIKQVGWDKIASALEGAEDDKFRARFPKAQYGR